MKAFSLGDLPRYFREKAEELREDFAAGGRARAVEWCAEQVEKALKEGTLEELTLDEAAAESGYSRSHLRRLLRDGALLNVGTERDPRIARGSLPRKPGHQGPSWARRSVP